MREGKGRHLGSSLYSSAVCYKVLIVIMLEEVFREIMVTGVKSSNACTKGNSIGSGAAAVICWYWYRELKASTAMVVVLLLLLLLSCM